MLPLDLHVLSLSLAFILSQDQTLHCQYSYCTLFCLSCSEMTLASDLLVYLYLSKGRNWRLGLHFPKRLLLHFCLSISIISKISQSQTTCVAARPFVSFASAKVKQSFHSTKSWVKLFRHHSRSKPCHSLLVRLTCDCKDTAIIPVLPNRDCCRDSCPLFRVLRHRTPNSPIRLSEVIRKPFALSQILLLFSGGKSAILVKKKAPSRSGILLSTHVVLKTRYVSPNIHVRRY